MTYSADVLRVCAALLLLGVAIPAPALGAAPVRPNGIVASDSALDAARALIEQRPALVAGAENDDLVAAGSDRGLGGTTVVRLQQEVDGVPVLGGEVVVVVDRQRRVLGTNADTLDGSMPDVDARIAAEAAASIAVESLARTLGRGLDTTEPTLAIFDGELIGVPGPPMRRLVWDLEVRRAPDVRHRVFVDADTGAILLDVDEIHAVQQNLVCDAANTVVDSRDNYPCNEAKAERSTATPYGVADVDAAYVLGAATLDFFGTVVGRPSINGSGAPIPLIATTRFCRNDSQCTSGYANAFWDGEQMVYGKGYASADDVVAHELTHGVTQYGPNLLYAYQSGAINEALSDIFGELFDQWYLTDGDTSDQRWLLGEDLPIGAVRNMSNPPAMGDPDK